MVNFVAFLEPPQYRNRILDARLLHQYFLKAPLERSIFLEVLTVFIQRGCTDTMQFTTCQGRLEHVTGIHRTLRLTGANHGVQFIDKQNDLTFLLGKVMEYRFEPFFKLATKLGTRYQGSHVQRQHPLVLEPLGDFPVNDALGESLDNRCLANTRFTNQNRIILGATL